MSSSQIVVNSIILGTQSSLVGNHALDSADATKLKLALLKDASDHWYSGLASLGEAISGVTKGRFSWATVKAYYASFYFARALLGNKGFALWYLGHTPYSWEAKAGCLPKKLSGNTHDGTLKLFDACRVVPNLCGQQIAFISAADWLIKQRNSANYKDSRFVDPQPTICFRKIAESKLRSCLEAYLADRTWTYCFDADHAILAFPIEMAKQLRVVSMLEVSSNERAHLRKLFSDTSGPYSSASQLFCF
jgi:uncharacterized protein (UPF0332 family)